MRNKNKLYIKHKSSSFTYFLFLTQKKRVAKRTAIKMASLLARHFTERTNATATKVPPLGGKSCLLWGFYRFYWYQIFTLILRRGLYNLVGCSARMEVFLLTNLSSQATTNINEKTVMKQGTWRSLERQQNH